MSRDSRTPVSVSQSQAIHPTFVIAPTRLSGRVLPSAATRLESLSERMRMFNLTRRAVVALSGAVTTTVVVTGLALTSPTAVGRAAASSDPYRVLAAVGDIACEPDIPENSDNPAPLKCGSSDLGNFAAETATAQQALGIHPDG